MKDRLTQIWADERRLKFLCIGLVAIVSCVLMVSSVNANLSIEWQKMFQTSEFTSWGQIGPFLAELQTAISPVWATLEIISQLLFGSTWIFHKFVYVIGPGIAFVLAIQLFGTSRARIVAITLFSLVFVLATRILHKGNPQLYDIYTPILFLAFILALDRSRKLEKGIGLAFWAGFFLSILELTRSFVFPMLPIFVGLGLLSLAAKPLRAKLLFLLPVLLLSGGWHAKQYFVHHQVHWSNLGGFNLQKTWVGYLDKKFENPYDPPRYAGGFANLNTDLQTRRNQELTKKIVAAVSKQPVRAMGTIGESILNLYKPHSKLYIAELGRLPRMVYAPAVWVSGLCLLSGFLILLFRWIRGMRRKSSWLVLGDPESILLIGMAMISVLVAIGEKGEEARFMISMLPMLAALPGWKVHIGPILEKWLPSRK